MKNRAQRDCDVGRSVVAVVIPVGVANGFYLAPEEVSPLQESCMTTFLPLVILYYWYRQQGNKECCSDK